MDKEKSKETKKKKSNAGRPTVMTSDCIEKLKDGFRRGLNVNQCTLYAGISRDCYYNFLKRHPEYNDIFDHLRNETGLRAVLNISDEIGAHNTDVSKWYLERRLKDEYGSRTDANISLNASLSLEDKESALKDFLSGFLGDNE